MKHKHIGVDVPVPDIRLSQPMTERIRRWLPSRGSVTFTLLVVGVLFWAQSVGAFPAAMLNTPTASTGTIAYQGRLADAGGAPLTGTYSMIFRLYNVATGGTPLWTEQWIGPNSVQVSDGLFNVMLGSMTLVSQTIITGNNNLWLGITVGTDDEMLPRVQLGNVPYAVQALTVPDGSITTAKLAPDVSLVPPPNSITTTMIADNAVTSAKLARKMTKLVSTASVSMPNTGMAYDILAATITLDKPTLVTIYASIGTQNNSSDTYFYTEVVVDGNRVIHSDSWNRVGIGEQSMMSTVVTLESGTHQIRLRATPGSNNSTAGGDDRTQLIIIEG
ncbi:hypothetical protein ANRL4_02355 [Anaerolineae bacterium]|nr:hypothetical protein ANRL4_02355 [Anaerolineae bacterium]